MKRYINLSLIFLFIAGLSSSCGNTKKTVEQQSLFTAPSGTELETAPVKTKEFPYYIPQKEPSNLKLSKSMKRLYEYWQGTRPEENELFTNFKYTRLQGFDYHNGDGTVTRRDATRIIKYKGLYYVYYTKRDTPTGHMGNAHCTETIPGWDWDLCDIWCATSKDGFTWHEKGVAVRRPKAPTIGFRTVCTPEILVWKGKFYIYFQAYTKMSTKGDDCCVSVAYSDDPGKEFTKLNKPVIVNGTKDEWDGYTIHDPTPVVFKNKIYLYYKSDYNDRNEDKSNYKKLRSIGLATSDDPLKVFTKSPYNPVMSSGHECGVFRYEDGICLVVARDGHEHNTIQFSKDGINFDIRSIVTMMPVSFAAYDPDAFTNTMDARGISWGICHNAHVKTKGVPYSHHTELLRFDCDLSKDVYNFNMKDPDPKYTIDELCRQGLTKEEKAAIMKRNTLK